MIIIETSTERSIACLYQEDRLAKLAELPVGLSSSKMILGELEKMIEPRSLKWVAVGVGPGSYTGIRVGAAIGKTLAFAAEIPLIGLCSLDGFIPPREGSFAAVIDAKMSGVYVKFGLSVKEGVNWQSEPEVLPLDQAQERLKEVDMVVTPYKRLLEAKIPHPEWIERAPDHGTLYHVAKEKYGKGEYTLDSRLDLLYMRKTQAEIERYSLASRSCHD